MMISKYNTEHLLPQSELLLVKLLWHILNILPNKKEYRYIAFSSLSFYDYKLFSSIVDMDNMIVIRNGQSTIERIRYNFPYNPSSIFDDSFKSVLNDLPIQKDVIRLQYQTDLDYTVLTDIEDMIDKIEMGSIFMLSVNVDAPKVDLYKEDILNHDKRKERKNEALEELNDLIRDSIDIEKELDPYLESDCILYGWNYSKKCRELIDEKIHRSVNSRNAQKRTGIQYFQLFNYNTKAPDGVKVLTVGGIIYDQAMSPIFESVDIKSNSLVNALKETKKINIPILTEKEIILVNEILPNSIPREKKDILIECTSENLSDISQFYGYLNS